MVNSIQIILISIVTFIAAIDQFNFLGSFCQPIVIGPIVGAILGDIPTGLAVGGTYQLMSIGNLSTNKTQPQNLVIGGIMATLFAIINGLEINAAIAAAIPFALLGKYTNTLVFTFLSVLNINADKEAKNANPKDIAKINYFGMILLGLLFTVTTIACILSLSNPTITNFINNLQGSWLMEGLSIAGGMMRYVGFAVLLGTMLNNDMWKYYFIGFILALILDLVGFKNFALLIVTVIAIAVARYDYKNNNGGVKNEF